MPSAQMRRFSFRKGVGGPEVSVTKVVAIAALVIATVELESYAKTRGIMSLDQQRSSSS